VHLFGVLALLPGDGAEESDDVLGDVILHCGAVADGVDVSQGCTDYAQMCVRFHCVLIVLSLQLFAEGIANRGAC